MGSQAMSFSVFLLGLASSSFCIENGENIGLEFLTKFLIKVLKLADFAVPEGAVTTHRSDTVMILKIASDSWNKNTSLLSRSKNHSSKKPSV